MKMQNKARKIMIVEDNTIAAEDFKCRLAALGYSVCGPITRGEKVLETVLAENPSLILMDIRLKGQMNGIEAAAKVNASHCIPIVYLTAHADPDTIERAKKTGPYGYIVKPFDDNELQSTVEIALYKHQLERRLLESQKWLETTLSSIGDGVIATDMEGRVTFINPVAESLTGWNKEEAIGNPLEDIFTIINEISEEPCENPVDRVIRTGQIIGLANHTMLISRDGRKIPIKDSGAPIRLNMTENIGVVLVFQDDTEKRKAQLEILNTNKQLRHEIMVRRRTEQKLKDNARMLHETQQLSLTGTWGYDPKTDTITWSEQTYANYGIDPQKQLTRKDLYEIIHPDFRRYHEENENLLLQQGENVFEYPIELPDGEVRWILATAKVFHDEEGLPARIYGLTQNITERKLSEKALRKSEIRYRSLFENAVEGFFQSTPDGRFISVNPAFAEMLGYPSPEEVIQKITDIRTELYVDPDDRDRYQRILRGNGQVENFEVKFRRKDGSKIWVSKSTRAHFNEAGEIERFDGIVMNISERKKAASDKIKLEKQLAQAQKLESIGNLAGGIAHDFNNILASVIGFTELAFDEVEKDTTLENYLQEVYAAGKRAKDLVNQILTFARQSEEEIKPIQVDLIVKEVLKLIRSSIPATIEVKQDLRTNSLIMGNPTQVHQMMMNLCANAAFAMEEDGGILEVTMKNMMIDNPEKRKILGLRNIDYIQLRVSDTGAGIPDDVIDSIFEPYFTTKGPGEGTGMGLAMVEGIVDSYNGKITVDSTIGEGTIFTIYLPATRKRKIHKDYAPEQLPTGNERILFVDDEASITKMGARNLNSLGYSVVTRVSSLEALELFRSKPNEFDLIVTDMTMPNMTGDELAIELMKIRPEIPVILCTGYSKKFTNEAASEAGIKAFAYKPIVKADLAKTVRKVLDEAKGY